MIVLGSALATSRARAECEIEVIRLVYQAPAGCPKVDDFLGEVRRAAPRLRVANGDEPVRVFTATLQTEGGARGRLSIEKDGRVIGSRDVEGATCQDVSRVLAFAVALAIDPNATLPSGVASPEPGTDPARAPLDKPAVEESEPPPSSPS